MKYEEENHARDLYRTLVTDCPPGTEITVQGVGVHWDCAVTRGQRTCSIACFDLRGTVLGPQYSISFKQGVQGNATGRTSSKPGTVAAVICWLGGHSIEELYRRFAFVDDMKRALAAIEKGVVQCCPELEQAVTRDLHQIVSDLSELWFKTPDRSCRLSYYGENPLPDCIFHWDECELFRFQTDDPDQLSPVLKRWLCDDAMPSQMRAEFPWIEIGPLADYYEAGQPVEGEFLTSWDEMERFYRDGRCPFAAPVLDFISEIRQAGYDRKLRAGQSLWSLVVSRSRRHGLRADQPFIKFWFRAGGMDVYINLARDVIDDELTFPAIRFTPEVAALLERLAARDID